MHLPSWELFKDHIEWVVGLENAFEFDDIGVVYWSHHFNLIQKSQSVAGIRWVDSIDFGESLDCELLPICDPFHLINGCESSLPQLFDGLEELMKSELVDMIVEKFEPDPQKIFVNDLELYTFSVFFDKFKTYRFGKDRIGCWVSQVIAGVEHLELEIEADGSVIAVLVVIVAFVAQSYVVIGEGEVGLLL